VYYVRELPPPPPVPCWCPRDPELARQWEEYVRDPAVALNLWWTMVYLNTDEQLSLFPIEGVTA
jgi:hypothetical protein